MQKVDSFISFLYESGSFFEMKEHLNKKWKEYILGIIEKLKNIYFIANIIFINWTSNLAK